MNGLTCCRIGLIATIGAPLALLGVCAFVANATKSKTVSLIAGHAGALDCKDAGLGERETIETDVAERSLLLRVHACDYVGDKGARCVVGYRDEVSLLEDYLR